MLTKTLHFDDDVLAVIRAMEFSTDGCLGKITGGQLDRKLYERTNKALETMGGKWNRGKGGHVFAFDPRPRVEGLLDNGSLTVERDGFFETQPAVTSRMFGYVKPRGWVLEPEAGLGAIAREILTYPAKITHLALVEKNQLRAGTLMSRLATKYKHVEVWHEDFLECDLATFCMPFGFDCIYMNPPFEEGQDVEHVRHAYDQLADDGAMVSVMGEHAFFANDRRSTDFRKWLEEVGGESHELPPGSFEESGTGVNTRLVVIQK
jgi:16S rRNA G966 N2-methylase RsmD